MQLRATATSVAPCPLRDPEILVSNFANFISADLTKTLDKTRAQALAHRIVTLSKSLPTKSIGEHMMDYVNKVDSTSKLFGSTYYRVSQTSDLHLPQTLMLAINTIGLHLQVRKDEQAEKTDD